MSYLEGRVTTSIKHNHTNHLSPLRYKTFRKYYYVLLSGLPSQGTVLCEEGLQLDQLPVREQFEEERAAGDLAQLGRQSGHVPMQQQVSRAAGKYRATLMQSIALRVKREKQFG